jgi:mono/diheme cytochrome c family protein
MNICPAVEYHLAAAYPSEYGVGKLSHLRILLVLTTALVCAFRAVAADDVVNFARDIQPILSDNCFKCHGPDAASRKGDLRLDLLDPKFGPLAPRDGYSIIVPGNLDDSVLVMRITSDDPDEMMPPPKSNRHLTAQQIETLKKWIQQGAKWGKHWSFEKPVRPRVPEVANKTWPKNPIDDFILARLEKEKIEPSQPAAKATLLRRVALDLTGLPPTPAEVDAFIADASPDAYEKQVDRLLASPHFGERWARHWLDNARYADSNGYSQDFPRVIWPYRDWVINAFNNDMPFDEFTIEQLAGDMLPNATRDQKTATGFHRNTQINSEGGIDPEQYRVESVVDRVATTGTVFLGLTIACAQCHDHKFDPITQKEYYEFFAFFNNADEPTMKVSGVVDPKQIAELQDRIKTLEAQVNKKIAEWEAGLTDAEKATLKPRAREALTFPADKRLPAQVAAINQALRDADNDFGGMLDNLNNVRKQLNDGVSTMVMAERKEPRKTTVLIKGDFTRPGEEVHPGTPSILPPMDSKKPNRLDLAKWIVDPENPLTARVAVNRIWQEYFGRGIVETENDFGSQGAPPTNPELLDYLATELVANHWSLKHIHRLIVTSAAYQQSSNARPDLENVDPYNNLLARQSRIRLDAEIVRDVALASSGLLSDKIGGPSVFPPIPDGVMGLGQVKHEWKPSKGGDRYRRGMYTFTFRNTLHPSLSSFDAPDAKLTCTRRIRSNTPLQALNLLNDTAWMEFSRALAGRVLKGDGTIDTLFRLATSRTPESDERQILEDLLAKKREELQAEPKDVAAIVADATPKGIEKADFAAWTLVARVVLNLDETITRE